MTSGTQYKQGDILLAPFPFSDLSSNKFRPVLVLSKDSDSSDIVICAITSSQVQNAYTISLFQRDVEDGVLPKPSKIRADKIFTINRSIIKKRFGNVSPQILKKVKNAFVSIM